MANYTPNYQLHQWEPEDKFLRTDFNQDLSKIDTALGAVAADTTFPKLLDLTLEQDTQKWDIDMSKIDLTQYQKLVIYPHLKGNVDQTVYIHINGLTSGYYGVGNNTSHCGEIPVINRPEGSNFGVCEFTMMMEVPQIYMIQLGVPADNESATPFLRGYRCPRLESGITHLDTLNLWFNLPAYQLLTGSKVQIYGRKR